MLPFGTSAALRAFLASPLRGKPLRGKLLAITVKHLSVPEYYGAFENGSTGFRWPVQPDHSTERSLTCAGESQLLPLEGNSLVGRL